MPSPAAPTSAAPEPWRRRLVRTLLYGKSVDRSVKSRVSYGGTAPKNVKAQAKKWLKKLAKERA